ncbi:MAG TPA: hypothetical protein VGG25_10260 [Streptosporangiaceae bacterium]
MTAEIMAADSQCYRYDGFTDAAGDVGQWLVDTLLRVGARMGIDAEPQVIVRISRQEAAACAVEGCGGD